MFKINKAKCKLMASSEKRFAVKLSQIRILDSKLKRPRIKL
jgi:hypothetical protein